MPNLLARRGYDGDSPRFGTIPTFTGSLSKHVHGAKGRMTTDPRHGLLIAWTLGLGLTTDN